MGTTLISPWYQTSGSSVTNITAGTSTSNHIWYNNSSNNLVVSGGVSLSQDLLDSLARAYGIDVNRHVVRAQRGWSIETPDGTVVEIDFNGNIKIIDDNAKVVYKANRLRDFNRYINASDLLEDFIRFAGEHGAKQGDVLSIPIEVFINWLIVEASKADGEEPPELPLESKLRKTYDRCLCCGRFITAQTARIAKFCSPAHYTLYLARQQKVLAS